MIPWLLIGGAIVAGGLLLSDSDDKVKVQETWREIPESEVPLDIRRKVTAEKSRHYAKQFGVHEISEGQVPLDIRDRLKK